MYGIKDLRLRKLRYDKFKIWKTYDMKDLRYKSKYKQFWISLGKLVQFLSVLHKFEHVWSIRQDITWQNIWFEQKSTTKKKNKQKEGCTS